ncbi:hypothetical protein JCM10914A_13590 [Paenibacillus sp. JCM 10914]
MLMGLQTVAPLVLITGGPLNLQSMTVHANSLLISFALSDKNKPIPDKPASSGGITMKGTIHFHILQCKGVMSLDH